MPNRKVYLLGVLMICGLLHSEGLACSCRPIDGRLSEAQLVRQARKQAEAVFAGKVTAVRTFGSDQLEVSFQVDKVWKGSISEQVVIFTGSNNTECRFGVPFREGERYLVYAGKAYASLSTSVCTRTVKWHETLADLRILGGGRRPKSKHGGD